MDVIIFRENTEDVYAGIEWEQGTAEVEEIYRTHAHRNGCGNS